MATVLRLLLEYDILELFSPIAIVRQPVRIKVAALYSKVPHRIAPHHHHS